METRKVKHVQLHAPIFVPGKGQQLPETLNSSQGNMPKKFGQFVLTWTTEGLNLLIDGRSILVPAVNIKSVEFEE